MFAPLADTLIVAMEQAVAAPFATSRLADAGARVIKLERADGDFARAYDTAVLGQSAYFVWLNRGKESVVVDIKKDSDRALIERLIARADVFIQNLVPGAAARAGFGSETLRRRHPRLITCDVSGYGDDGPYRDMKAYDFLIQVETGLASITGGPNEPSRVGVSLCDIAAGMYAATAISQALLQRQRTGAGVGLKVSLFDALSDWMSVPLLLQEYTGKAPARAGLNHPGIAPYGAYACGDGQQVVISIQNEREWQSLCSEVLGEPELARDKRFHTNELRVANRAALDDIIRKRFGQRSRTQMMSELKEAQIAFGALNSVADFSRHPQLRRLGVESPAGVVNLVAPPVRTSEPGPSTRPIPSIGEHDAAIRREFGS
jgi:crotonobetainyl-CoA:carnitine CoA-transferase CaiB-like acyl-CoA transferase